MKTVHKFLNEISDLAGAILAVGSEVAAALMSAAAVIGLGADSLKACDLAGGFAAASLKVLSVSFITAFAADIIGRREKQEP